MANPSDGKQPQWLRPRQLLRTALASAGAIALIGLAVWAVNSPRYGQETLDSFYRLATVAGVLSIVSLAVAVWQGSRWRCANRTPPGLDPLDYVKATAPARRKAGAIALAGLLAAAVFGYCSSTYMSLAQLNISYGPATVAVTYRESNTRPAGVTGTWREIHLEMSSPNAGPLTFHVRESEWAKHLAGFLEPGKPYCATYYEPAHRLIEIKTATGNPNCN